MKTPLNLHGEAIMRWIWVLAGSLVGMSMGGVMPIAAQSFAGTGQQATELFRLEPGLAVWELEHQGAGRFLVRLLSEQGAAVETLADATGEFRGSKAVQIPQGGRYLLDVAATGGWSARLRGGAQPMAAGAPREIARDSLLRSRGAYWGEEEARKVGAFPYMVGGLLGGLTLGPIGAGIAFSVASGRDPNLSVEAQQRIADNEPPYVEAFSEAYRQKLRSQRRTASIVGGVVGTGVLTFVVGQITNWGGTPRRSGPGGGEEP